jgi:hypothetical protein
MNAASSANAATPRPPGQAPERRGELRDQPRRARRRVACDAGVASLEYLGMLPFLLLVALAGIQLGLVAYCGEQAGTAARAAARTAAQSGPNGGTEPDGERAGRAAVSDWLTVRFGWGGSDDDQEKATASVPVPSVLPGVHLFDPVQRSATMPKEDTTP